VLQHIVTKYVAPVATYYCNTTLMQHHFPIKIAGKININNFYNFFISLL
jgi:hypothetical protein